MTIVLLTGCVAEEAPGPSGAPSPTSAPMPTPQPVAGVGFMDSPALVEDVTFAHYAPVESTLPSRHEGYTLPIDLEDVANGNVYDLSDEQQRLLMENAFVVVPAEHSEFFHLYQSAQAQGRPLFITTDSVLHVYHLLFDKVLRTAEEEHFFQDLVELTRGMLWASQAQHEALTGTPLEEMAKRNVAYFAVAAKLLEPDAPVPELVKQEVESELSLIDAHEGFAESSIFPKYQEDYSQYVPRGHYTRTEVHQRYFKAMMWYGRINLRLREPEETQSALLIAQALSRVEIDGEPASALWERTYEPTVFFVGATDDLNIYDYQKLMVQVYGSVPEDPGILADTELLDRFTEAARELPPPQINSMWVWVWEDRKEATQGFRFMGQRFVIDAYIFQQLIYRNVDGRFLPKGLDVFAAMGSEEAYELLDEMGETQYPRYVEQMDKVRGEIAALEVDSWTQNLYWSWLYAFQPVIAVKNETYPAFMRTEAWAHKDLHTALGSWTELKHDTILYAKQAYAELTAMPPQVEVRGYVEPNPRAYARLAALARMTVDGLGQRGLLSEEDRESLEHLEELLLSLKDIAEKELEGTSLTESDYELINSYGDVLERLTVAAADKEDRGGAVDEEEAAIVADVATDPNSGTVLEEAVGTVFEIYVVADIDGQLTLTEGGVFSYYEFPWPMSDRLTDESWRELLNSGEAPGRPDWTSSFVSD
ncbi:MAG: DUF3160 domain-containing protein [Anaerolineae bacterium]|nr:DUF3160 domain-containing protein [Anaerolineae bacterium]